MKQRILFFLVLLIAISSTIAFQISKKSKIIESMIYFPIHGSISFSLANTSVNLLKKENQQQYSIIWSVQSSLTEKAYLRQDVSLLFVNGRLYDLLGEWQQQVQDISLQKQLSLKDSAKLNVISFHHGEIHEKDQPIKSAQLMSAAKMYIVDSKNKPLHSFITPVTKTDRDWQKLLDKTVANEQQNILNSAKNKYNLNLDDYDIMLLTELVKLNEEPLANFTTAQTQKIVGELWEGLYKNYYLNIKKADGTTVSPIGSTIPLLLFSKNNEKLLILFESTNEEIFLLRQSLPNSH